MGLLDRAFHPSNRCWRTNVVSEKSFLNIRVPTLMERLAGIASWTDRRKRSYGRKTAVC